jgi:hypothetical protein
MPTRKAGKKASKRAPQFNLPILKAKIRRQEWIMYGPPIWNAVATGNIATMRATAALARTHLKDVQKSIEQLDAAIRAGGK